MNLADYLTAAICAIPSFFLWATIHELAHYLAVRGFRDIVSVEFMLYPHNAPDGTGWRWAGVYWTHAGAPLRNSERAAMLLAPQKFRLAAAMLFPFGAALPEAWRMIWLVLLGGSLVDSFVAALGISSGSDISLAASALGVSPWRLRWVPLAIALAPIAVAVGFALYAWQ